jgi:glutathione S-transferase
MMLLTYPVLYSFRRCPYAVRSRLALQISKQVYELREVSLKNKPPELLQASPKGTVPVLIDIDGRIIDESIDIMLWSLTKQDPENWLSPQYGTLLNMKELINQCDQDFKYHLDRYKYPNRFQDIDPRPLFHRQECVLYLQQLEQKLTENTYLFGNHITLADMAIAPFVRQFAHTDKDWFNQQLWSHLHKWLDSLINSELYVQVMAKNPPTIMNQ